MRCIVDKSHNPYWNLAAEEYILNTFDTPTIRLWQNSDSIIVGKNQNTLAQINLEYVKNQNIAVVRRVTGGGAVFHDLGNINFSFFDYKSGKESNIETFHRFSIPIIEALKSLGADAAIQGRNDIAIDGKKVSGCAMLSKGKRILCHGTLLYNSNISNLADALKHNPEKFRDKSVDSNRSRVTNISEHICKDWNATQFLDYLHQYLAKDCEIYHFSERDIEEIDKLCKEKYSTEEWNFGASPKYQFINKLHFKGGTIELYLSINQGIIEDMELYGDYFFNRDSSEFCNAIIGTGHNIKEIADKISKEPIGEYFTGITSEELLKLFF